MKDFLKPDKTWDQFGFASKENFIERFVTTGKFHKNVPIDIQKDYEIVERLQFYSYFKYELLDEAFARATRIFEASVDLRIRNLGLEKKGKFESLHDKIKKLEKHTTPEIYVAWQNVRRLRNLFAHHVAGRSLADNIFHVFRDIINLINSIFLEIDEILPNELSLKSLKANAAFFEEGLFLSKIQQNLSVISSCRPHALVTNNGKEESLWCLRLIYPNETINVLEDFAVPIYFTLRDVEITENGLKATVVDWNDVIEIFPTDISECVTRKEMYNRAVMNAPTQLKEQYDELTQRLFEMCASKFFYNAW